MTKIFVQCAAVALVSILLILALKGRNSEIAVVVSIACCCIMILGAASLLNPIWEFIQRMEEISMLDHQLLGIMLKAVGIGFLGDFTARTCEDAGNAAIAKTLQLIASLTILYLSLPLFQRILELIERILGNI